MHVSSNLPLKNCVQLCEVTHHAFIPSTVYFNRRWRSSMADQHVYPNGGLNQVDFERDRCHWRVVVARQLVWIVPFLLSHSRRIAGAGE